MNHATHVRPLLVLLLGVSSLAAAAPPASGRYSAQLCVGVAGAAAPSCGSADADWHAGGRQVKVRISDISYRLALHSSQVDVVVMHGTMQIDEFTAAYEWLGKTLSFVDAQKNTRYELRLGAPRGGSGP